MAEKENEMMVLRTVYLPARMDTELRDLAHRQRKSKNDLIRASVANRLIEWRKQNSDQKIADDMQLVLQFS